MPVTLRMALRNLVEHRSKSLIVGTLLALGVLILILGNAFLDASRRGIETSFTKNYTADVVITGVADGPVSLFGVQSVGGLEQTPIIPEYEEVFARAAAISEVEGAAGMASGFGLITPDVDGSSEAEADDEDMEGRMNAFVMLFGVDAANYWPLFRGLEAVQGRLLEPGQRGIILPEERLKGISEYLKKPVSVGDEILIQGMGAQGIRLRSVPIVGTYRLASKGAGPEQLSYIDIDTLRALNGMTLGSSEDISLGEAQTGLLDLEDLDSLFGDSSFLESADEDASEAGGLDLDNLLGDTSQREILNQTDSGSWHAILLRLKHPSRAPQVVAELNRWFSERGIEAEAGDWQKAAGPYAQSVDVLRVVFSVAVIVLAVVAVIIIMNTLVVSVIERTGEIGTMRALGAGRGFVRRLFAAETSVLSLAFGLAGVVLSALAIIVVNLAGIKAGNEFFTILFGGPVLRLALSPLSVLGAMILVTLVGLLASVYPVAVALRIQPVRAMQSE